jgi:hypothetical protein
MSHNRRRRIFLNTETQRRIILGFCLVPTIALVLGFVAIAYYCTQLTNEAMSAGVELTSIPALLKATLCFVFIAGATTVYQAVVHSHRIAGPIVHIVAFLRERRNGDRSKRLCLRETDYLNGLAGELNRYFDHVDGVATEEREDNASSEPSEPEPVQAAASDAEDSDAPAAS